MSPLGLRPTTLTAFPLPTAAAALALLLFGLGRVFFLAYPDAFIAYPETQAEYNFYKQDLRCKAMQPVAQVVIQGTSRLELVQKIPLFEKRWHTKDRMLNVSQPLNTFWHMNLLHRRNPGLLNSAELWIMDVLPAQMRVAWGFNERDALFLRESTLAEKLRVRGAAHRAQALTDGLLPVWSQHHSVANWGRALLTLNASPQERLDTLTAIDGNRLPDITGARSAIPTDPQVVKKMFAEVLYTPGRPISRIQIEAFHEILARRPPSTHLLLIHPPFRGDFGVMVDQMGGTDSKDEMRRFIESAGGAGVHVEWLESPGDLDFTDEDFAPDGIHGSFSGIKKYEKHFARRYREWIPLAAEEAPPAPND